MAAAPRPPRRVQRGRHAVHSFLSLAADGRDLFLVELLGAEARFSDLWLAER